MRTFGMPSRSIATVDHMSSPAVSRAFSSRVSSATRLSMSWLGSVIPFLRGVRVGVHDDARVDRAMDVMAAIVASGRSGILGGCYLQSAAEWNTQSLLKVKLKTSPATEPAATPSTGQAATRGTKATSAA